jgi:hypothetical protein
MLKKQIAFLLLCALVIGGCAPQATPSPKVAPTPAKSTIAESTATPTVAPLSLSAKLSEVAGKAEIKQASQTSFSPASVDSVIEANGQVQTGDDGRVRLDLSSGTIIRVAPSSLFTLTSNEVMEGGLATRIKLELGKIFIILNGGSAEVETPSGVASVRGSYLKVEIDPVTGDIKLTCLEGNCSASNSAGSVDFTSGQSVVLHPPVGGKWTAPKVGDMTIDEFNDWLKNNPEALPLIEQALGGSGGVGACVAITSPEIGTKLPATGEVNFDWEPYPGTGIQYKVTITSFNQTTSPPIIFYTTASNLKKHIDGILPQGGDFSWSVTVLDENGNEICSTTSSFSKPKTVICDPHNCSGRCADKSYCPEDHPENPPPPPPPPPPPCIPPQCYPPPF